MTRAESVRRSRAYYRLSRTLDDPDQPAGDEALPLAGDSRPILVGNGTPSSRVRESPITGEVNNPHNDQVGSAKGWFLVSEVVPLSDGQRSRNRLSPTPRSDLDTFPRSLVGMPSATLRFLWGSAGPGSRTTQSVEEGIPTADRGNE
jgi:hypothetical protein